MKEINLYESKHMSCMLGGTLRPGGFALTDKGLEYCGFKNNNKVLDIGCGRGDSVNYLNEKYKLDSYGIDPSALLLNEGKEKYPGIKIFEGRGEDLPFDDDIMDGVFAECTMSLMDDLQKVMKEAFRVLKKDGWFIITDVYAKNPQYLSLLNNFSFKSCLRGLHDVEKLKENLINNGFTIKYYQDYSDMLKQLMVKIIFEYGSMNIFWSKASSCSTNSCKFQEILSKCKVGYFLLIAKKE